MGTNVKRKHGFAAAFCGDFQIEQAGSIPGKRFYFLPTYSLPPLHRKSTYFIKFLLKICRKSEIF